MSQQFVAIKQANLQIIKKIMEINQIKLEELIEFLDLNQEVINKQVKVEKQTKINSIFTKVSSKWGDDAVGLEEDGFNITLENKVEEVEEVELAESIESVESVEEVESIEEVEEVESIEEVKSVESVELAESVEEVESVESTWKDVVKKHNPNPNKSKIILTSDNTNSKKLQIVNSLSEFVELIKQKKKLFIDFLIDDNAHCEHTFNGTLCPNVKLCGKIHLQRCINNLNCSHKNCPYLHMNDMYDKISQDNFMDTMEEYNDIKKNKKVCM